MGSAWEVAVSRLSYCKTTPLHTHFISILCLPLLSHLLSLFFFSFSCVTHIDTNIRGLNNYVKLDPEPLAPVIYIQLCVGHCRCVSRASA